MAKKLAKSIRKFIRKEKARIRREVLDIKEQENLISELYSKLLKPNLNDKKNIKLKIQNAKRKVETQSAKPI